MKFRSGGDPVLYLSNPAGFSEKNRRTFLDALGEMNRITSDEFGDPEIATRISQYELAYRMQTAAPDAVDLVRLSKSLETARYSSDAGFEAR